MIIVDSEFKSLLIPLTQEEYNELEQSILAEGCRDALVVWGNILVDGHNRYEICTKHGLTFNVVQHEFADRDEAVLWILRNQLARRNLDEFDRTTIALQIEGLIAKKAAENLITSTGGSHPRPLQKSANPVKSIDTREEIAKLANVSHDTVHKVKTILEKAPESIKEKVRAGDISIHAAYTAAKSTAPIETIIEALNSSQEFTASTVKAIERRQEKENTVSKFETNTSMLKPRLLVTACENMARIDSNSVDIIITSPPYNLGNSSWPMGGRGATPRLRGIGYDDDKDELNYQNWQVLCFIELYRVAKEGASFFYNHKPRNRDGKLIHPMDWIRDDRNPWVLRQEIIWDRKSTHNHSSSLFWPEDERIYWMTKGRPALPDHSIGMSTIWQEPGPEPYRSWHPASFPDALPEMCLRAVGTPGGLVLDPFAGSCTTVRVALSLGYNAIGVDISEDYLNRAREENKWMINLEI